MASYLSQNVLPSHCAPQRISLHRLTTRTCSVVAKHILENDVEALGVSLRVAQDGALSAVVFATSTNVFFVDLAGTGGAKSGRLNDLQGLLCHSSCVLAGFGMARIALHLYRHCGLSVKGVDLSTLYASSTRTPQSPAEFVSTRIYEGVSRHQIHKLWYRDEADNLYLRAWLSAVCAEDSTAVMEYCAKVDTRNLTASELQCLTGLILNVELLDAGKPTKMENEFDDIEVGPDGQLLVRNARYNTRLRPSKQTSIVLETSHGRSVVGQAIRANGKQTDVVVVGGSVRGAIERICVIGREEFTNSEFARDEFILLLLHGAVPPLIESPFIRMLWFPTLHPTQRSYRPAAPSVFHNSYASLNTSQKEVVRAMWSDEEPLVVAHGPPGTGKTTTIAAALEQWDYRRAPAWVIAQSNVGVKNIARTLIKYNVDFRLIVSKEFYVEWHEHLYESIEERLIRSDDLFSDPVYTERKLSGATTILCTVAMLSNPALDSSAVFRFVPVERLIVDEASQIDSFEFLHLFHTFKRLEKVCMFGDPKQLPPYGKETAPLMKTIFDFKQLKPLAYFLNTQYRMPVPLGDFISDQVYNSKLKSVHNITDGSCVRFVDVRKGAEESVGSSWKNTEEVHAIVNLVQHYYKRLNLCVITPYDAQRAAITARLKAEDLPWECVYNVDSFQGHEAPYVIVSTVRTTKPGFLRSLNRMNVMLTRCKAGMIVVTNRRFLDGPGRDTLLGGLAQRWRAYEGAWVDALAISSRTASLPGAPCLSTAGSTIRPIPLIAIQSLATRPQGALVPGAWPVARAATGTVAQDGRIGENSVTVASSTASTGTTYGVKSLFQNREQASPPSRPSTYPLDVASVTERMGRLSTHQAETFEDTFPALGSRPLSSQPRLAGRWTAGSDACKLSRVR